VEIAGLWNFTLEDSIVLAFQNRAEQQLAQRNISEQQRRIALSSLGPQGSDCQLQPSERFNDDRNFRDNYALNQRLLNLFDGGEQQGQGGQGGS